MQQNVGRCLDGCHRYGDGCGAPASNYTDACRPAAPWCDKRQQKNRSRLSELRVAWLVHGQLAALDVQMGPFHRAPTSTWSLPDGSDLHNPAGCEEDISADTVSKLCEQGQLIEAVEALGVLVRTDCRISQSLLYTVLKRCVAKKDLVLGRRVHALIVRAGYEADTFLCNIILRMYGSHASLQEAMDVFTGISSPDAFTWSCIISAHVRHGQAKHGIRLYHEMRRTLVKPDGHVFVAALQACARGADLTSGQQVHADVMASGVENDLFVSNGLVDMYAKCGRLEDAQAVFGRIPRKDVVSWTALIAGYSQHGLGQEALRLYRIMEGEGIAVPSSVTFVCLLQACASVGSLALEMGKQLHAQIRERGFQADVVVANSLVNMYAKCGRLEDAQSLFDKLVQKNVVTWTSLIAGYSQQGMGHEALDVYSAMQTEGIAAPNSVTFVCLLQACASVGTPGLERGEQLHAHIRERGLEADMVVGCSLVNMYAKCGSIQAAQVVFDGMGQKNVVTWNAMIAGFAQQGMGQEALRLYDALQEDGSVSPNSVTFVSLLQACASLGTLALEKGKELHAEIGEQGLQDVTVGCSLVNMYAKCGSLENAQSVFDGLAEKDVVTWNAMISGYSQQGMGQEALHLYRAMQGEGMVSPDSVTFVCLLQACACVGTAALEAGKQLHAQIGEQGLLANVVVCCGLVNMYAKCGSLEDAQTVFDGLGHKDVVTWNTIIAGYTHLGLGQEALRLYRTMQSEGLVAPNTATFSCVLQACANVGALHLGKQLHVDIEEQGLQADACLAISLIYMYAKCGSMVHAQQVFDTLPKRDVVAWNALIAGYTHQGDSEAVFGASRKMKEDGIQPNDITFNNLLTVCSHAGLVNQGQEYFDAMSRNHGLNPNKEHYTCMVDILGRAGKLDEGLAMARAMPVSPDAAVWHTLLSACCKWSNVEIGRHAFHEAMKLDEKDPAAYVLMSNILAAAQMWEEAEEMQARRKGIGARKQPGQSWWTDMDGMVHRFSVGDTEHPDVYDSYARLKLLASDMKKEWYVPQMGFASGDNCDDQQDGYLSRHNREPVRSSLLLTCR